MFRFPEESNYMYAMNHGLEWLGGGAYNLIAVNAPVEYTHGRERLEGQYALVLWENKTDPILRGREQSGMPKLFADIQDLHQLSDRLFINASYEGSAFLRMDVRKKHGLEERYREAAALKQACRFTAPQE